MAAPVPESENRKRQTALLPNNLNDLTASAYLEPDKTAFSWQPAVHDILARICKRRCWRKMTEICSMHRHTCIYISNMYLKKKYMQILCMCILTCPTIVLDRARLVFSPKKMWPKLGYQLPTLAYVVRFEYQPSTGFKANHFDPSQKIWRIWSKISWWYQKNHPFTHQILSSKGIY